MKMTMTIAAPYSASSIAIPSERQKKNSQSEMTATGISHQRERCCRIRGCRGGLGRGAGRTDGARLGSRA